MNSVSAFSRERQFLGFNERAGMNRSADEWVNVTVTFINSTKSIGFKKNHLMIYTQGLEKRVVIRDMGSGRDKVCKFQRKVSGGGGMGLPLTNKFRFVILWILRFVKSIMCWGDGFSKAIDSYYVGKIRKILGKSAEMPQGSPLRQPNFTLPI